MDELDSREFYDRHEPIGAEECVRRFEAVKEFVRERFIVRPEAEDEPLWWKVISF